MLELRLEVLGGGRICLGAKVASTTSRRGCPLFLAALSAFLLSEGLTKEGRQRGEGGDVAGAASGADEEEVGRAGANRSIQPLCRYLLCAGACLLPDLSVWVLLLDARFPALLELKGSQPLGGSGDHQTAVGRGGWEGRREGLEEAPAQDRRIDPLPPRSSP